MTTEPTEADIRTEEYWETCRLAGFALLGIDCKHRIGKIVSANEWKHVGGLKSFPFRVIRDATKEEICAWIQARESVGMKPAIAPHWPIYIIEVLD